MVLESLKKFLLGLGLIWNSEGRLTVPWTLIYSCVNVHYCRETEAKGHTNHKCEIFSPASIPQMTAHTLVVGEMHHSRSV